MIKVGYKQYMTREEAAKYLGTTKQALATWASLGLPPAYIKPHKLALYLEADLIKHIEESRRDTKFVRAKI